MKRGNAKQIPSRFMTHNPRLEREEKKKQDKSSTPTVRSYQNSRNSSIEIDDTLKSQSRPAVRTLKHELKNLDMLQTMLYQWAYALGLAEQCFCLQSEKSYEQLYDRGQQIVELKKTVIGLSTEIEAREKTHMLDDVLSMEYSSLKAVEDDILLSSAYLQEIENAAYFSLHRLRLDENIIVSPSELLKELEKAKEALRQIENSIDPEAQEIKKLGQEVQEFLEILNEELKESQRNQSLISE